MAKNRSEILQTKAQLSCFNCHSCFHGRNWNLESFDSFGLASRALLTVKPYLRCQVGVDSTHFGVRVGERGANAEILATALAGDSASCTTRFKLWATGIREGTLTGCERTDSASNLGGETAGPQHPNRHRAHCLFLFNRDLSMFWNHDVMEPPILQETATEAFPVLTCSAGILHWNRQRVDS